MERKGEMTRVTKNTLRMGESSVLGFKAEKARGESIAKGIVAFANTDGGTLLVGVRDDGTVEGVRDRRVEQRVVRICRNNIVPSLIPMFAFTEIDGETVLAVEVPRGPNRPYRVKTSGKFYIRAGSSSLEPTNEELVQLFHGLRRFDRIPDEAQFFHILDFPNSAQQKYAIDSEFRFQDELHGIEDAAPLSDQDPFLNPFLNPFFNPFLSALIHDDVIGGRFNHDVSSPCN